MMSRMQFSPAILWNHTVNNRVICNACSHRCNIPEGKYGICGTRKNINGQLFTNVYEFPIALNIDPIEKKPLFHFIPGSKSFSMGTAGCNFKCLNCQNDDISQMRGDTITGSRRSVKEIITLAKEYNCKSIAYTYNEPVVFLEYVLDCAKEAHKNDLKNVYISNGFETPETIELLQGKIDAMNIDLKSFRNSFYKSICGGKLEPVLKTIRDVYKKGFWLEITTLIIPGYNDTEEELKDIAKFIAGIDKEIPWHISRFFPAYKMLNVPHTPIKTIEKAKEIGLSEGLKYIYPGNIHGEETNTYCPQCEKSLIKRKNYQIVYNKISDGECPFCGYTINGVFK